MDEMEGLLEWCPVKKRFITLKIVVLLRELE